MIKSLLDLRIKYLLQCLSEKVLLWKYCCDNNFHAAFNEIESDVNFKWSNEICTHGEEKEEEKARSYTQVYNILVKIFFFYLNSK